MRSEVRKEVLSRDQNRCRKCKSNRNVQFHHVKPQRLGGEDEVYNLALLCHNCHSTWHSLEARNGWKYISWKTVNYFFKWLRNELDAKILLGNSRFRKESEPNK